MTTERKQELREEFFSKFVKTVGNTTKHYEFRTVEPFEMWYWVIEKIEEAVHKRPKT